VTRRGARAVLVVCGLALAGVRSPARAQTTTLTITSGQNTTFVQPTLADYVTGYIDGGTINFTVTLAGGPASKTHTTTVEICATTANLGSGKALSKLMWQPSDASKPWQSITQGCTGAVQAARTVTTAVLGKGGSFSLGVKLRMILDWTDTAASYGTTLAMTVDVTTP
jgi:hypothetical protein